MTPDFRWGALRSAYPSGSRCLCLHPTSALNINFRQVVDHPLQIILHDVGHGSPHLDLDDPVLGGSESELITSKDGASSLPQESFREQINIFTTFDPLNIHFRNSLSPNLAMTLAITMCKCKQVLVLRCVLRAFLMDHVNIGPAVKPNGFTWKTGNSRQC